ncbi:MAG TPA: cupin domain-containing protein [Polyangiaceae bacterium]|nr:cupin domain-containing protein [Polyangiaceae bacterium]
MKQERRDWPEFVREAVEEHDAQTAETSSALRLGELFETQSPAPGLERLLSNVTELPLRYAPFYDRLCTLWDLPEPAIVEVLERARDPKAWHGVLLPGLKVIDVHGGPKTAGADCKLVNFSAGLRFPKHRHPGHEAIFVLEGSYTDSDGRLVGAGDLHEMLPGTEHAFTISKNEPCIAASLQAGLEFTGPLLGTLRKLFGGK